MAAHHSPRSAKHPATVDHRTEELRKGCAVAFAVLSFNAGVAAYLLWGDVQLVASVGVTYVLLVLLFARRFGYYREPAGTGTDGAASWRLDVLLFILSLSVAAILASRLVRTSPPSSSALLVAAAGAAALGVGASGAAAPVCSTGVPGLSSSARTQSCLLCKSRARSLLDICRMKCKPCMQFLRRRAAAPNVI